MASSDAAVPSVDTPVAPSVALGPALRAYGARLHAAEDVADHHHVLSPLGVWLLVALAGSAAREDATRAAVGEVLGLDVDTAAATARRLLAEPHPDVAAATAAWSEAATTDAADPARLAAWREALPAATATGPIPSQADLDAWTREHTLGLIDAFPADVPPDTTLMLATALATRISWREPFTEVPADRLGGAWRVPHALLSPAAHAVRVVDVAGGRYVVHTATSAGGLAVLSVLPAGGTDAGTALDAAYAVATDADDITSVPLVDLPLGPGPWGEVTELERPTGEPVEAGTALLPPWSADTLLGLTEVPGIGVGTAGRALADVFPTTARNGTAALQRCVASYSATGFEAAAVTAMMRAGSFRPQGTQTVRRLSATFDRPYAVVAVVRGDHAGPWRDVPVFSGWVAPTT
ncbi:serpin family protein [Nocardioides alkalitolerans]|uniref:serpin family protein n=1 Tax=Nocardioides alkalitolerans TaxID=281714 RepID=UPI00041522EC|nr:serpin family protein [Nocardioides alkalitolerans]